MHTESYKGYEITVDNDPEPIDPRREQDNMATMAFFHGRYWLGDRNHGYTLEEVDEIIKRKDVIAMPVYMYDHSGLTITVDPERFRAVDSCGWDWGKLGYIFVTHKQARDWLGISRITAKQFLRIEKILKAEIEEYDGYLRGERYYYAVKKNGEVEDSCYDFHTEGDALSEAKSIVDHMAE